MICPTCGAEIADNSKLCLMCGNSVLSSENVQTSSLHSSDNQSPEQQVHASTVSATNNEANPNKKGLTPNIPALLASIVFLIGSFLPYYGVTIFGIKGDVSLVDGSDGVFFILVGGFAIISALLGSRTLLIVSGGLALLLAGFEGYHVFHKAEYAALYSREVGYYCTLVGSIATIASGLLWKNKD